MNTDKLGTKSTARGITAILVALSITVGMATKASEASSNKHRKQSAEASSEAGRKHQGSHSSKSKSKSSGNQQLALSVAANDKDDADKEEKSSKDKDDDKDGDADKKKANAEKEKEKEKNKQAEDAKKAAEVKAKAAEEKAKAEAKAAKKDAKEKGDAKASKAPAKEEKGDQKGFFKIFNGKEEAKGDVKNGKPSGDASATKTPATGDDAKPAAAAPAAPASPAAPAAPAAPKPVVQVVVDTTSGAEPKFMPDAALISILKDISKGLLDNEDIKNVEDPAQKIAIKLAAETLSKALANPELSTNRIIAVEDRPRVENRLVAENWDSQLVQLSPTCTGSLSALWAKRANGLINIAIAGTCGCKAAPGTEDKIGEWVVILNGKSAVDKGFDIQTQSDVPFWLGKLNSFTVEATACTAEAAEPGKKSQSPQALILKSVLTERARKYQESLLAWQNAQKLAVSQAELERTRAEEEAKAAASAKELEKQTLEAKLEAEKTRLENELRARLAAEAALKAVAEQKARELIALADDKAKAEEKAKQESELKQRAEAELKAKTEAEAKAKAEAETKAKAEAELKAKAEEEAKVKAEAELKAKNEAEAKAKAEAAELAAKNEEAIRNKNKIAATGYGGGGSINYGENPRTWDSPASSSSPSNPVSSAASTATLSVGGNALRAPHGTSGGIRLLVPERAVAGQYVTATVVDDNYTGASYVEINFNGAGLTTANDGTVHYLVPEDSQPGPTMVVAVPSQPLEAPHALEVLQPLNIPSSPQVPSIDRANPLVSSGEIFTIEGHSFDGVGSNNRVIIDGAHDAKVLAASPVQLKVELPRELIAGHHSVVVSTAGLRSNPTFIDVVKVRIETLGRDDLRKLKVCVLGTQNKVTLKLQNRSPGVVKLAKGDEQYVTTTGGPDNCVIVTASRVGKGDFSIEARVEHPTAVSRAY